MRVRSGSGVEMEAGVPRVFPKEINGNIQRAPFAFHNVTRSVWEHQRASASVNFTRQVQPEDVACDSQTQTVEPDSLPCETIRFS